MRLKKRSFHRDYSLFFVHKGNRLASVHNDPMKRPSMSKTIPSYNPLHIILHWLIATLIVANYFISDHMPSYFDAHQKDSNSPTNWVENFHIYVGLSILALVVARIIVRVISKQPEKISTGNAWLDTLSRYSHKLLYLLMLLVPALGALAWYFNLDQLGYVHVVTINAMMIIVLLHAAAALFHHYVLKDRILTRMLGRS
jgi:cytochrome b561